MSTLIQITKPTELIVNNTPIIGGVAGRVLFQGTGNVLQQSSSLFWDSTNNRLGIGTSSPSNSLTIKTGVNDDGILLESSVGNPLFLVRKDGNSNSTAELFQYANGSIRLAIRSALNFSYFNGGNFGFGTTTDAGFRLDVNGNTRINGDITAIRVVSSILRDGNNNAYINNSLINIATTNLAIGGTTVGEFTFTTKTSGGKYVFNNANVLINTTTDAGYKLDVNGTARVQSDLTVSTGKIFFQTSSFGIDCNTSTGVFDIKNNLGSLQSTRISFSGGTYFNIYQPASSSTGITSGIINTISTPINYTWSSGTVQSNLFVLNPNINNTGTYSGTFRGFYYNPTLTSMTGTTHFAIHTTSGRVRFEGLPTSAAGLSAGEIWNDGGTIRIV
jgi:hypothetical protein